MPLYDLTGPTPPLSAYDSPILNIAFIVVCAALLARLSTATAAKLFVWSFFMLIANHALTIAAFKFGAPIRPIYAYAVIAAGLFTSALLAGAGPRELLAAKPFFLPFLALVVIGALMYRGEMPGPDFGAKTLYAVVTPSSLGYAIWPALNLVSAAGLYLLAQRDDIRRTIVLAAFTALAIQVAAMEADMWWPALFGDPNGRAGGLAQNANDAALLVVLLAALSLRTRLETYAVALALTGALLSQSKTGLIMALVLIAISLRSAPRRWLLPIPLAFCLILALGLGSTLALSPVLNPTPEMIAEATSQPAFSGDDHHFEEATLDLPVTLDERLVARTSVDESAGRRMVAARFFLGILRDHPFGLGTGFTNKFLTGPHNEFLKLGVDTGLISPLLFAAMLAYCALQSIRSLSPQLVALTLLASISSLLYHTLMPEPAVLPILAMGLALSCREHQTRGQTARRSTR